MGDRWRTDPHMDLLSSGISKHLVNLSAGGSPDNGVIDGNDPFTLHQPLHRIQFDLYTEVADRLLGFDEGSSDIVISNQTEF